jgi:Rad3-related DNA helicase
MKFRQGFGRLIRSGSDRGAVVCLDSRLLRKGYGHAFLDSLPPCRRLESLEELGRFFQPAR